MSNIKRKIVTRLGVLILIPAITFTGMTLTKKTPFQADSVKVPRKFISTIIPEQPIETTDLGYIIPEEIHSEVTLYLAENEEYIKSLTCTLNKLIDANLLNEIMTAASKNDANTLKNLLINNKIIKSSELRRLKIENDNSIKAPYVIANLYGESSIDFTYRLQTPEEQELDNETFKGLSFYGDLSALLIMLMIAIAKGKNKQKVKEIKR